MDEDHVLPNVHFFSFNLLVKVLEKKTVELKWLVSRKFTVDLDFAMSSIHLTCTGKCHKNTRKLLELELL